ncbi:putative acyl-activating enzyme 16 [Citrus sinensis]|nr:putative acyl-activating enzyme 16 [Citrus sinensis]
MQLEQEILDFAEGLRVIGVKPEEKLSLFSDNSCRWLVADQGMLATGAINVVRGSSVALAVENPEFFNRIAETLCSKAAMRFIILLWGKKSSVAPDIVEEIPVFSYDEIIDLGRESRKAFSDSNDAIYSSHISISQLFLTASSPYIKSEIAVNMVFLTVVSHLGKHYKYETIGSDDIATYVYTSGTTGNPKGVMLTHKNLLHQIRSLYDIVPAENGDKFLSMLPPWHVYERACGYFIFSRGIELMYTAVRNLKDDLQRYQPHYMISVPLVYETLYSGIQKQIFTSSAARRVVARALIRISFAYTAFKRIYEGFCLTRNQKEPSYLVALIDWLWARIICAILWPLHLLAEKLVYKKIQSAIGISKMLMFPIDSDMVQAGVSGGGSLPMHIDLFYEAIGVKVQVGYGLTESSPVIAARRPTCNVLGSVGHPIKHTEIKIVDAETNEVLPAGSKGIVKVRGSQVMQGYFKNPSATKQALDEDGWLNTGDIGWIAPHHSRGRSRRCGGVLVLEGRAKDTIVLSTGENVEPLELEEAALRSSLIRQIVVIGQDQRRPGAIIVPDKEEVLMAAKRLSIVHADASELSKEKTISLLYGELRKWTSKCSFQIGPIHVVDEPFTIDSGLMTPTMKIRRDRVAAQFKEEIENLYK